MNGFTIKFKTWTLQPAAAEVFSNLYLHNEEGRREGGGQKSDKQSEVQMLKFLSQLFAIHNGKVGFEQTDCCHFPVWKGSKVNSVFLVGGGCRMSLILNYLLPTAFLLRIGNENFGHSLWKSWV